MVNIVKTSGVVELISGNQEWNVVRSRRAKVAGFEAASMIVAWDKPVDSSGPWVIVQCDGARQMFSSRGFTGITQLMVHVGLESGEVLAYSVTGDPGNEAAIQPRDPNASMKFYDFKTGELGCVDILVMMLVCQMLSCQQNNGTGFSISCVAAPACMSLRKKIASDLSRLCCGLTAPAPNGGCFRPNTGIGTVSINDSPVGLTKASGSRCFNISPATRTWNT